MLIAAKVLIYFYLFYAGFNPVFDETFEFHVNLPEIALLRFVVLDDDFIGDGFVGQFTMPVDCLQSGILLLSHCIFIA